MRQHGPKRVTVPPSPRSKHPSVSRVPLLTPSLERAALVAVVALLVFTAVAPDAAQRTYSARNSAEQVVPISGAATPCSPGPYCGGDHDNLREPWVPYPKVPAKAPDGLPYGVVGPVGAQGQEGPYVFTRGIPSIRGTAPSTRVGANTSIVGKTYWNNETLTLVGNITIGPSESLTINDSSLIFDEPAASAGYSFGITLLSTGTPAPVLRLQSGTTIAAAATTESGIFITHTGQGDADEFLNNTTLAETGNAIHSPGKWAVEVQQAHFDTLNFANTSTGNVLGTAYGGSAYASGTIVENLHAVTQFAAVNCTFSNSQISDGYAPGQNSLVYNTYENENASADRVFGSVTQDLNLSRLRFVNANIAYLNFNQSSTSTSMSVENVSVTGLFAYGGSSDGFDGSDRLFLFGSITNTSGTMVAEHNTITDLGKGGATTGIYLTAFFQAVARTIDIEYNYEANQHVYSTPPPGFPFIAQPWQSLAFAYNIFQNWSDPTLLSPYYSNQVFDLQGQEQMYNLIETTPNLANGSARFYGNWLLNSTGQNWLVQLVGSGIWAYDNTIVNLSTSGGLGSSVNSGLRNGLVFDNVAYGVYNYSYAFGSNEGGSIGTTYNDNIAYDVDATSYSFWTATSVEIWNNSAGSLFLQNANNSNYDGTVVYPVGPTTKVTIDNSVIDDLVLQQLKPVGGYWTNRSTSVLPTSFNISVDDSYLPATAYELDSANGTLTAVNPFALGTGGTYNVETLRNPSALTLSGYLGVFAGQDYHLNTSLVRGEPYLPIIANQTGKLALTLPATEAGTQGWSYSFHVVSANEYQIGAGSVQNPSVVMEFAGVPGATYEVLVMDSQGTSENWTEPASASGEVPVNYDPAVMPLEVVFSVTCVANCASTPGVTGGGFFLGIPLPYWILLGVAFGAIGVYAGVRRKR